jgi:hypothetical protein
MSEDLSFPQMEKPNLFICLFVHLFMEKYKERSRQSKALIGQSLGLCFI